VGDITEELPAADLLISKDVLQHLSNALVHKFIRNNLKKGKYKWVCSRMTVAAETQTRSRRLEGDRSRRPSIRSERAHRSANHVRQRGTKVTSLLDLTLQP
jgi:hypothetical protein